MDLLSEIARAAEQADGAAPLDEAARLALRNRPDSVWSVVRDGGLALVIGSELSVVVHPDARGRGLGSALVQEALEGRHGVELAAWSHGNHPAAVALARRHGFEQVRELWVMRRVMTGPDAALPALPELRGVTLRGFRTGDESELLRVNGAAFAAHPEQGSLDRGGLTERMAEPWFDADGLVEAWDGDRLLGFHWTKLHSPELGEVYVVGIDPEAQGRGLGKLLTLAGLHHLADRGVDEVLLYVESDNQPAIAVYEGLGFGHADVDTHVQYRRPAGTATS